MEINLFKNTLEEVTEKMLNTQWIDREGTVRTVAKVYVDKWHGGYCVEWQDKSWNRVASVLANAEQVTA